jgi:hypothetical protein
VDSSTAAWLLALGATIAVETLLALWIDPARARLAIDVPLVNLVTHPLAWAAVGTLGVRWLAAELLVVAGETAAFRFVTGLPVLRAVRLAVVANAASALLSFGPL